MSTRAGAGLSQQADAARAAAEAASMALEGVGSERADWGLVFATPAHRPHYAALLAAVQKTLGTASLAGCSGAGVMAAGEEIEDGPGIAVLAVRSDRLRAEAHLSPAGDDFGRSAAQDLGSRLPRQGLLVAFPDPFAIRPDLLLREMHAAGVVIPAVGTAAGGAPRQPATFQFFGRNVATRSLVALHVQGPLRTAVGITQGCQPLGPPCRVTRASDNTVLELDGRPALTVLRGRLPGELGESLERLGGWLFIGMPPDPSQETMAPREYLVRPLVAIDPERGALLLGEDVVEGQWIYIVLRDAQAARDDLKLMLERLGDAPGEPPPSFGLYFNCAGRGSALYGFPGVDAAFIAQRFGPLPIVGVFGNAEIAPLGGRNLLFTHTGVLVLVGEAGAAGEAAGPPAAGAH
jgi:small ligand-binding sensory domain FIST